MVQRQKSTVLDIRRANRSAVLRLLYQLQSMSRQEVGSHSGLSSASVTNVVVELLQEGVVLESGMEASQGGRPRSILTINPNYGFFIGVEVGDTLIRVELFDLTFHKRGAIVSPLVLSENQPEQIVEIIDREVQAVLSKASVAREHVIGIGVSVGGIVEQGEQQFAYIPTWGWKGVPLATLLENRFHMPVYLENAAKVMAQAEYLFGVGQGYDHVAVLLIETGIGAGIIADGSLYRGASNSAGEWGHTKIELEGRLCRCGGRGCLEAYVGAPGIITRLREKASQDVLLGKNDQEGVLSSIVASARHGDLAAHQVLKDTAQYLGAGIANIINLFNPQFIVLGGWAGLQIGEFILPDLRQFIERYALNQPFAVTKIGLSQIGQDATAMGAATIVLEHFLTTGGKQHLLPSRMKENRFL